MRNGKQMTGYAMTTVDKVIEAKALPSEISSQKSELLALPRALQLSEGIYGLTPNMPLVLSMPMKPCGRREGY